MCINTETELLDQSCPDWFATVHGMVDLHPDLADYQPGLSDLG